MNSTLVLASTSPRRRELLALLKIPFETVVPSYQEWVHAEVPPEAQARSFALEKARSCMGRHPGSLILGSDTLIAAGTLNLGKPAQREQARAMLQRLRGREHRICSAVAVCCAERRIQDVALDTVQVWMKPFSDAEIEAYLDTGEWQGKAGAYAVQGRGADLIEKIQGDFTSAVGLPLRLAASLLARHGLAVPVDIEQLYRDKPYPNWRTFQN